jgi:hypothetical protein
MASPTPSSIVYGLCVEYKAPALWSRYYAFRMNPCYYTWAKLRRQIVPWQRGVRVEQLLADVLSHNGRQVRTAM